MLGLVGEVLHQKQDDPRKTLRTHAQHGTEAGTCNLRAPPGSQKLTQQGTTSKEVEGEDHPPRCPLTHTPHTNHIGVIMLMI